MVEREGIDPHLFVVLGATGDLMQRKLLPALFHVSADEMLRDKVALLGAARRDLGDAGFRELLHGALTASGVDPTDQRRSWADSMVHYQRLDPEHGASFGDLKRAVESAEAAHGLPGNRIFYLALPLDAVPAVVSGLGDAGLATSPGWVRLVVEKPFGVDLASAQALNAHLHRRFQESDLYRIDHYLGKETVQNLLVFRFANTLFESAWNRDRVEAVEITVAEDLGVEDRAGYYETAGALRDMVQNHLTQVLTLVAMDVPAVLTADAVRNEKVKVLQAVKPVLPADVVLGQYGRGQVDGREVAAYREEPGVAKDSRTETFAALKLSIGSWRWEGVPFLVRTGKRLPSKSTRIVVSFRRPPVAFFASTDSLPMRPNTLTITVQPDEGFELSFEIKVPGHDLKMQSHRMHFRYSEAFGPLADGYQTLLTDLMRGDQTLFVRADEVEAAWRLYDDLLTKKPAPFPYPAGSEGPVQAESLAESVGYRWSAR